MSVPSWRGGVETLDDVLRWIVAAEDGLLFAERALAGLRIVIEDRTRRDERFVVEADVRGREFGIGAEARRCTRVREFDAVRSAERIGFCGDEFAALAADRRREDRAGRLRVRRARDGIRRRRRTASMTFGRVGNQFAPEFAARVFDGDGHQAKRAADGIGADEEGAGDRAGAAPAAFVWRAG